MKAQSYWLASSSPSAYPALNKDLDVQVLVIGGGVTGLTTAFFLAQAGMKVALVERSRLGGGDSGHTTAHLTYMTDTRLSTLVKQVGQDHALAAWDAGAHAMNVIQSLVEENHISCEFRTIPGFLALEEDTKSPQEGRSLLIEEADLASRHGLDIAFEEQLAPTRACGNRFSNQFKFHPLKYLQALAKEASAMGASIFENTAVAEFKEDSRSVVANGHIIRFEQVVIATHTPLQGNAGTLGALLFQTKLYAYSTYAIQATVPSGSLPEMIWSDTADPFLYLRVDRGSGHDIAILGGKDHKTGQVDDTEACYQALSATLLRWVPEARVERRWSGQVIETPDGLPYLGDAGGGQFVATGFSGNGYTYGTLAAVMVRDALQGLKNPWTQLFDPGRKSLSGSWNYLKENADYPYYLLKGFASSSSVDTAPNVDNGHGKILMLGGKRVAVYRDDGGLLHRLSPICPHLGCLVEWNPADQTWDCPCHGSRFQGNGKVFAGPAEKDLDPLS